MALNIKSRETDRLAHELAALTGESVTGAVKVAIQERLERLRAGGMAERLRTIAEDIAPRLGPFVDHGALLYDDKTGLPKSDR
jgi:antitoxin VapB